MKFVTTLVWSGAAHGATSHPERFSRDLDVSFGTCELPMSSAPDYRGDASRANPEQLFVAALSSCQALTFLYLAARKGIHVVGYADDAEGELESVDGRLRMTQVRLRPRIVTAGDVDAADVVALVHKAHHGCFIANSVTAAVEIVPAVSSVLTERREPLSSEIAS
jgi:organic hydroperoxide reductase OsmC/OhrA